MIKCEVKVDRILYPKKKIQSGDWAILCCQPVNMLEGEVELNQYNNFVVRGTVPEINFIDTYTLIAKPVQDKQYGLTYELVFFSKGMVVDTPEKRRRFLETILTGNQVDRLYLELPNPFEIIEQEDIETLAKINGFGLKTARKIIEKFKENIMLSDAYVTLDSYGLTKNFIDKLVKIYKSPDIVIEKIHENPYMLIDEVFGIGWKKADEIALASGFLKNDKRRVKAFVNFYLRNQASEGNSWVDPTVLRDAVIDNIEDLDIEVFKQCLYELYDERKIMWTSDKSKLGLVYAFNLEVNIANELKRLLRAENTFDYQNYELIARTLEHKQGWEYTPEQHQAIKKALDNNVCIITGGAGTGKSSVVSLMLEVLSTYSFAQTALAGRAASRLSEITGAEGYTIHRLLGFSYKEGGFAHTKLTPLPYDIIIVDEVSMVGGELFYDLIQAIRDGAKLIMLGDDGQLPSIGMLNLFKDMMDSGEIPVARLTKIHRQAEKSAIITESIKVRNGEQICSKGWTGAETRGFLQDFTLDIYDDKLLSQRHILRQFEELYDGTNINDIQILVPVKFKGEACTYVLNNLIQERVNPLMSQNFVTVTQMNNNKAYQYNLIEGDKIIINTNCYSALTPDGIKCPIFNGNVGMIKEIDIENSMITIYFDQYGDIILEKDQWRIIELGYAISVHKSQGSQYKYVIGCIDFTAFNLLSRELLYTLMTRASLKLFLCAEISALRYAIGQHIVINKQTFLVDILQSQEEIQPIGGEQPELFLAVELGTNL